MNETRNARIVSTMLGVEDHGIFTLMVHLDYGGAGQGFGGYALDGPRKDSQGEFVGRFGSAAGMQCIMDLLNALGVDRWEKLPGTVCRVRSGSAWGKGPIEEIGHYMKDQWFSHEASFAKHADAEVTR